MKKLILLSMIFSIIIPSVSANAQNPTVFKLGFLSSLSGTFAAVSDTQRKGVLLAAEQINAQGGLKMPWGKVKIEVIIKDDEAKLDVGVRRFRELVAEGINGLTGTIYAPMAASLNEECKINPLPFFPCGVLAFDSFKKGNLADGTFSVAFTPWSVGYLGGACITKVLRKKTVFHASRSDAWGKFVHTGLEYALKEYGGQLVGFAESPMGTIDYTSMINKAKSLKPDVFYDDFFAGDAIASIKQSHELGLSKVSLIFNAWTTNVVAMGIPENALPGMYALEYYYYNLENFADQDLAKKAKEYTDAHMKKWGEPPDPYGTFAYVAVELLAQGVEKAGSFDPKKVAKAILEAKDLTCVKGPVYFRQDHQLVSRYAAFMVKGKPAKDKKSKWDLFTVEGFFGGESVLPPLNLLGY
jgi:branched-chain amino acid transport system substrate-binding protein